AKIKARVEKQQKRRTSEEMCIGSAPHCFLFFSWRLWRLGGSFLGWQSESEHGAAFGIVCARDATAVRFEQAPADRQPQTQARFLAVDDRLEQASEDRRGDAWPRIMDTHRDARRTAGYRPYLQMQLAAVRHGVQGVEH